MPDQFQSQPCLLCQSKKTSPFHQDTKRSYRQCHQCHLVFVPKKFHPSREEEKSRYDLHQNNPQDPGYRRFLSRIIPHITKLAPPPAQVLDFGCGPMPALAQLLTEAGYTVTLHDPFYHPNPQFSHLTYDFITATEVLEHLHHPLRELKLLVSLLKTGASLALMTKILTPEIEFSTWHYKNDLTHVAFYTPKTLTHLAHKLNLHLSRPHPDIIILQRHQ